MTELTLHSIAQEAHALITGDHAREIHEDYLHDARNGLVTIERYTGFLQGLAAAEALDVVEYYELRDVLSALAAQVERGLAHPPS